MTTEPPEDTSSELNRLQAGPWFPVGVVVEGDSIDLETDGPYPRTSQRRNEIKANAWDHRWESLGIHVMLPHPAYPQQRHRLDVYQIRLPERVMVFAAGELSANVWGFYVPVENLDFAVFSN